MYEPFPGNYVWNLSVNLAIAMGGSIGEMDRVDRAILSAANEGEAEGTAAFFAKWVRLADELIEQAERDVAAGNRLTAANRYRRACVYLITAERMQGREYAPRRAAYRRMLECHRHYVTLGGVRCEHVIFPFEAAALSALFCAAPGDHPAPCVVFCNGLDSVKEMAQLCGIAEAFNGRGISVLFVDQPGTGDALRLHGLPAMVEAERWAGAAVDYLESRADVLSDRIGMIGWSLGGYYAPRAAAFEKRFALCVAWGANHGWGEMQERRRNREGENPVPHYWDHVMWVWGFDDIDAYMAFVPRITLDGVVEQIDVPFLITHGSGDRQIPVEYAYRSREQATASPDVQLHVFETGEAGIEHCNADDIQPACDFIADWVAHRFQTPPPTVTPA